MYVSIFSFFFGSIFPLCLVFLTFIPSSSLICFSIAFIALLKTLGPLVTFWSCFGRIEKLNKEWKALE